MARWVTVIAGLLGTGTGLLMATYEIQSLWDVFLALIGLFGGSLAGLVALGVFTTRAHGKGALVGAFTSAAMLYVVNTFTEVHFFLYAGIGILVCFGVGYVASLLIPAQPKDLRGVTFYTLDRPASSPVRTEAGGEVEQAPS